MIESKRNNKISIYLNEEENKKLNDLKLKLPKNVNINDFIRNVILYADNNLFNLIGLDSNKKISNNFIFVIDILKNRNISKKYFNKILNNYGLSSTNILRLDDLLLLKKSINSNQYRSKLLLLELDKHLSILYDKE